MVVPPNEWCKYNVVKVSGRYKNLRLLEYRHVLFPRQICKLGVIRVDKFGQDAIIDSVFDVPVPTGAFLDHIIVSTPHWSKLCQPTYVTLSGILIVPKQLVQPLNAFALIVVRPVKRSSSENDVSAVLSWNTAVNVVTACACSAVISPSTPYLFVVTQ